MAGVSRVSIRCLISECLLACKHSDAAMCGCDILDMVTVVIAFNIKGTLSLFIEGKTFTNNMQLCIVLLPYHYMLLYSVIYSTGTRM